MSYALVTPEFRRLEQTIENGLQSFVEVGKALMEIRDKRLYKERDYSSFAQYCQEHWGFKRSYAYELIDGAKAVSGIPDTVLQPANAGQAAELARAEDPAAVWGEVVAERQPSEITAAVIREHVERHRDPAPPTEEAPVERVACPSCGGCGYVEVSR